MKTLPYFFSVIAVFTGITIVHAQSPEDMARQYGITFPIAELSNCASFEDCRSYCDSEINRETCIAFAKQKGFYREVEHNRSSSEILEEAQAELGCTSESSCRAVCEQSANHEKCRAFARKHGLGEGPRRVSEDVLTKARERLGCDSEETCRAVCEQEANHDRCSTFARDVGLGNGHRDGEGGRTGPGGCTSEETCRLYCMDEAHAEECGRRGEEGNHEGIPPSEVSRPGPGGCDSEESCRKYCEGHPDECGADGIRHNNEEDGEEDEIELEDGFEDRELDIEFEDREFDSEHDDPERSDTDEWR
ncbi:hypothetical protein HY469_05900, partial [Candidatus Roizmanbacteria bacterium]|nr:hypothetical protein [Candidatus Roizmanbacteria bacterium]